MSLVLLGFGVGIFAVGTPGPVSLSLIQFATVEGRASGTKAAVGIVTGDVILSVLSVSLVTAGSALPDQAFEVLQYLSAAVVISLGAVMISKPQAMRAGARLVSRPYRTFLLLTTLVPSAFGSWLAVLAVMPFAGNWPSLAAFALGIVLVSLVWHLLLGNAAGHFGPRMSSRLLTTATRIGGLSTVCLGLSVFV